MLTPWGRNCRPSTSSLAAASTQLSSPTMLLLLTFRTTDPLELGSSGRKLTCLLVLLGVMVGCCMAE